MQTPIPEPYDITEIPHIPWVPGVETWASLFALLVALTVTIWIRKRRRSKGFDHRVIDRLLSELNTALHGSGRINIERSSRLARRIVSHLTGRNLSELTSEELRVLFLEGESSDMRRPMEILADFEAIAYSPPSPQREAAARELGGSLNSLLSTMWSTRRTR